MAPIIPVGKQFEVKKEKLYQKTTEKMIRQYKIKLFKNCEHILI